MQQLIPLSSCITMPELPEVEVTRRALVTQWPGRIIRRLVIREGRLRWPIPPKLPQQLAGRRCSFIARRGKYLIIHFEQGALLLHLGMSGSLRFVEPGAPIGKHDHVDFLLENKVCVRFRDPRRFGSIHWTLDDPLQHPRLCHLGPEPLGQEANADYYYRSSRGRTTRIKCYLMDSRVIAGLGNIYVNEALFVAGIDPGRSSKSLTKVDCKKLDSAIRSILNAAISVGGSTLRDFTSGAMERGYFQQQHHVYQRAGEECFCCGSMIAAVRLGGRSSFFCCRCQS